MTNKYLLGIDIGTYSSKGVLVDLEGKVIASHIVEHVMEMPKPGYFEHDADKVWWHDFVEISRELIKVSDINPNEILSVGTSAIGSCVLPIDENGNALRPGILYGIDTRASKEIEFLNEAIGKNEIFEISGVNLSSQASGPKILWIKNNEPEIFSKTSYFLTSEAYLVHKLTGIASIDIYTAGFFAPIFNLKKKEWTTKYNDLITPNERMPKLFWSHEVVGKVTKEASKITHLAEGTSVIAGTTDAASEAISAGVSQFGDMMMMFGSSIFFIMKTEKLMKTQRFWSSNFLEKGAYAFLGGMSTSGSITRWFRDQFGYQEMEAELAGRGNAYAALADLAATSPRGSKGLVALPYFEGERTPLHDPKAKGVLFGLSLKHTKADIYRALLESVAFGIRHNIEIMKEEGVEAERILAVGGGTKNMEWMKLVCDIANISMGIPEQQIGASYGDAFMAGVGIGEFDNLTDITKWVKLKYEISPDPSAHKEYSLNYSIYRRLYDQSKDLMHELSNVER